MKQIRIPALIRQKAVDFREINPYASLYYYKIGGLDILFKLPTRREIISFFADVPLHVMEHPLQYDNCAALAQTIFLKSTVLYPSIAVLDEYLVKDIFLILNVIVQESGFLDQDKVLQDLKELRNIMKNSYDNAFITAICSAFPWASPEEIDTWDLPRILRHAILAEGMLGQQLFGPPPAATAQQVQGAMKPVVPKQFESAFDAPNYAPMQQNKMCVNTNEENKRLATYGFNE